VPAPTCSSQRKTFVRFADNDAPRIGEHAATRGRIATEGGDEHAGASERYSFERAFWSRNMRCWFGAKGVE